MAQDRLKVPRVKLGSLGAAGTARALGIRMSAASHLRLDQAAEAAGVSRSAWAREILESALAKVNEVKQ